MARIPFAARFVVRELCSYLTACWIPVPMELPLQFELKALDRTPEKDFTVSSAGRVRITWERGFRCSAGTTNKDDVWAIEDLVLRFPIEYIEQVKPAIEHFTGPLPSTKTELGATLTILGQQLRALQAAAITDSPMAWEDKDNQFRLAFEEEIRVQSQKVAEQKVWP